MRTPSLVVAALLPLFSACSDSDQGAGPASSPDIEVGVIVDAPIQGLSYRTDSLDGVTNERGEYLFNEGDMVTFELAGYEFRATAAQPVVTIIDLFESGLVDRSVLNLARLLQSLDTNDLTPDLIELPDLAGYDLTEVDFNVPTDEFALLTEVRSMVGLVRDELVSSEEAIEHLERSFDDLGRDAPELLEEGDSDGDGIDDLVDSDDDNDGVADLNGGQPLPGIDPAPENSDPVDNSDSDSGQQPAFSDGINNISDAFLANTADSDRDDIPDAFDFFPTQRASIFYVDVGGVDIGDCSFADVACASIGYAASLASPGDLVQVFGGDYSESNTQITTDLLTIQGLGSGTTRVRAALDDNGDASPILTIAPGLQVQIAKMTLADGLSPGKGSALRVSGGMLYMRGVRVTGSAEGGIQESAVYAEDAVVSLQETGFLEVQGRALEVVNSELTVNLSSFEGGEGSHIHSTGGSALLSRNLFSENQIGAAIELVNPTGEVRVDNSTFVDNSVAISVPEQGSVVANHITVRSRFFGGLASSGSNLILNNSYLYEASCSAPLMGGSGNLIWNDSCGSDADFNVVTAIGAISNELASNGGTTMTLALEPNSPAVDAVSCLPDVTVDQRSQPRPAGMLCDAGAYELQP